MVAQQCDLEPGEFIWTGGDCHLYVNHLEQARLQQSLQRERNLLRTLINNLPDHIYLRDREDRFILANRAVAEFKNLVDGMGAKVTEMMVEDHDPLISLVLGLSHAVNISFFSTLKAFIPRSVPPKITVEPSTMGVSALFTDPYFPILIQGVSSACNAREYSVMLWLAEPEYERRQIRQIMYSGLVDGVIVYDGRNNSLCTVKDYGDFEMYVDWKIGPNGDSGIYLRGSPQVQIWDAAKHPEGSGGLYNNQKNPRKPLVKADRPVGEWNTFRIIMIGDRVTVYLNDARVVEDTILENYWERDKPIYATGQIELQNHGNFLYFRNIYIREIPRDAARRRVRDPRPDLRPVPAGVRDPADGVALRSSRAELRRDDPAPRRRA